MNKDLTSMTIGSPKSEYLIINVIDREYPLGSDFWDETFVEYFFNLHLLFFGVIYLSFKENMVSKTDRQTSGQQDYQ